MDSYDVDEPTTRLKTALDINDLRDPQGNGAEFEVADEDVKQDGETEQDTVLNCYEKNQVLSQICMLSDDEDDENDDETLYDQEHLKRLPHEMEILYKKMFRTPNSDITPNKDGGVLKQIKTIGVGSIVTPESLVRIHYNAFTDVGESPYDSSRLRGESWKLRLGKGESIPGLELAILSMRKQETSRFLIRYDYAFGKMGCPPRIPQEATIIMDVEVLHYVEQEGVDDYYSLTHEERRSKFVFVDIEKVVRAENQEGKEYFAMKNFNKAYGKFKKSINILEGYACKNAVEEKESNKWKLKAYVNSAICCHNMCHFGRVVSFCGQALELDRKNVKALYYKGKALHSMGDFGKAEHFLKVARNVDPTNTAVSKALKLLARSKKDYEALEKEMCQRMISQSKKKGAEEKEKASENVSEEKSPEEQEELECSDRFKEVAQSALQKFNDDPSCNEMVFPPMSMSLAEINFLVETVDALGLSIRYKGTGNSKRHEVYKLPPK